MSNDIESLENNSMGGYLFIEMEYVIQMKDVFALIKTNLG